MKKTYKMPLEALMALLQGKDVHFRSHDFAGNKESMDEIVLLPPHGNVVLTREEFETIKRDTYDSGFARATYLMGITGKTKESFDVRGENT